jgi:periplasmic mercuric ion binding protein
LPFYFHFLNLFIIGCESGMCKSVKTVEFKFWGNCGMCKKTFEKSLAGADGVLAVDWDKNTKMMKLSYDTLKTSVADVEVLIAAAGYDTQSLTADDDAYAGLHECCQYDRK